MMKRIASALFDERAEISGKVERAFESIKLFYTKGNKKQFSENLLGLRKKLGLNQKEFSETYGIDLFTLRNWEQRRTKADRTAQSYLNAIAQEPKAIARAILKARQYELSLEGHELIGIDG